MKGDDMGNTRTRTWDASEHLRSDSEMAAYLEAALEDGNPALVTVALSDIPRARGMTKVARDAGLGRESLYKALSPDGNPELATVLRVVRALGPRLQAVPVSRLLFKPQRVPDLGIQPQPVRPLHIFSPQSVDAQIPDL